MWNNLSNDKGIVKAEDLFLFLLSINNLLDCFIISKYNDKLENPFENNSLNDSFNLILDKSVDIEHVNNSVNNKITDLRKYGGFDDDGNFLLNFHHARLINRHFHIIYINRSKQIINLNKKNK